MIHRIGRIHTTVTTGPPRQGCELRATLFVEMGCGAAASLGQKRAGKCRTQKALRVLNGAHSVPFNG